MGRARRVGLILLVIVSLGGIALPIHAQLSSMAGSEDFARARQMAERVDSWFSDRWQTAGIAAAKLADDGEFLRRVYLDLTGNLPPVSVTRKFLADTDPAKRLRLIDNLVDSPQFAAHMATVWRRFWYREASSQIRSAMQLDLNAGCSDNSQAVLVSIKLSLIY